MQARRLLPFVFALALLSLPGCLAEAPPAPAPAPTAGLAPADIDIGPGPRGLSLVRAAAPAYEYAKYVNALAGKVTLRRIGPGRYSYRAHPDDAPIAVHLFTPQPDDPTWLIAEFLPPEPPSVPPDVPVYMFLRHDGQVLTLLPLSTALFDAWRPQTPAGQTARARLARTHSFGADKIVARSASDLRDLMTAARLFPKADRVTYRLTAAAPGQ